MHGSTPADWRFLRGWSEDELALRLRRLGSVDRNYREFPGPLGSAGGWRRFTYDAFLDRVPPDEAEPYGAFQRARAAIADYAFTDSKIVRAHFDPASPLLGRRMLLEIRVLGMRWLCGVVVGAVWSEAGPQQDVFGFRYDTLAGHIERGRESFFVTRSRSTGEIRFRIDAAMRPGDLPAWWARVGFFALAPIYQRVWHRRAQQRLRMLTRGRTTTPATEAPAMRSRPGRFRESGLLPAAALGAMAGLRSMAAPALLSRRLSATGASTDHLADRLMSSRATARFLALLAAGELAADKLPFMPPRTWPGSLLARAASGALCGAAVAARFRRPPAGAALVGAAASVAAAFVAYRTRRHAVRAWGLPDTLIAVSEDLIALAACVRAAGMTPGGLSRRDQVQASALDSPKGLERIQDVRGRDRPGGARGERHIARGG